MGIWAKKQIKELEREIPMTITKTIIRRILKDCEFDPKEENGTFYDFITNTAEPGYLKYRAAEMLAQNGNVKTAIRLLIIAMYKEEPKKYVSQKAKNKKS